jgi:hypothetical protein
MSYSYGKSIVTDGLVFYVDAANSKSYPGTGTTWSDLVGSNDGTFEPASGPTYSSANGGSIAFDGTDDRVDIDYTPEGQSSITICSWFKTTRTTRQVLIGAYSGFDSTNSNGFSIDLNRGSTVSEQDSIFYFARIGTGQSNSQFSYATNTSLSNGSWHFIAVTHDLPTGTVTINVDNTSYSVTDTASSSAGPWGSFEFNPKIGANNSQGTINNFVDGQVSCMSIYNRVLSGAEITQNYNALKNRFI